MCDRPRDPRQTQGVTAFIDELIVGMVNLRIYGQRHPRVQSVLEQLERKLRYLTPPGKESLVLGLAEGYLIHEGRPLLDASLSAPRLIHALEEMGCSGIRFDRETDQSGFIVLLMALEEGRKRKWTPSQTESELRLKGCETIFLLEQGSFDETTGLEEKDRTVGVAMPAEIPIRLYQDVIEQLQTLSVDVCRGNQIDIAPAKDQISTILKQLHRDNKSLMRLALYESYDAFTFGHSIRVCFLALNHARHLTDDEDVLESIGLAALLHDVGKVHVPFEILHSQTRLTAEERREMEKHTWYGAQVLLELDEPEPMAVASAMGHHRTLDGGGYPQLVKGVPITAATRLIKIADVYEALTAVRPYKDSMSPQRAYRIMFSMKGHFDPVLLKHFILSSGVYPAGSWVELSDGRHAQVEEQSGILLRPILSFEDEDEEYRLDLSESEEDLQVLRVLSTDEVANRIAG